MNDRFEEPRFEDLFERLARARISRRDALKYAGKGAGALGVSAFLAACGVEGTRTQPSPTAASPSPLPPKAGQVQVANWPLYIDLEDGESATLDAFEQQTSIDITYREDINDNDEFFGTDLRQQLSAGQPSGWDIITVTDWMVAKLARLGWLQPLHQDRLPNCRANLDEKFKDSSYDPGRIYSYPWAAGITGIGYNKRLTGRPITSVKDLFDPAFSGKVGMFSEMRDTVNFGLYYTGVTSPENATMDDVERAIEALRKQRDDGIVRAYYGNDYVDQLAGGNLALTMAWSGDVNALSVDDPDLEFVVPDEGGNRFTDNMCIPLHAEHPTDAHEWINFVYDVEIAAQITEWVWYESPVVGVRELIREHAQEDESLLAVSESDLVWPSQEVLANTHDSKILSAEEEEAWHELFDPLIQG
ncbi:MAG: ABC transporter substrate-binding protein [Actinomycetota bacterium]